MSEAIIPQVMTPGAGVPPLNVENNDPGQPEPAESRVRAAIGTTVAGGVVAAEMTPANEAIRLAAFGAVYAATGDGLAATAAGAATALALEGSAAVAATHLLQSGRSSKAMEWMNSKLSNSKLGAFAVEKTNVAIDAGITLLGGTAILLSVKHLQDPERTKAEDVHTGIISTLGVTALTAAYGAASSMGVENLDNPLIAGTAAGLLIGGGIVTKKIKNRLDARADDIVEKYRSESWQRYLDHIEQDTEGPQLEGFYPWDKDKILDDPRTVCVTIHEDGKEMLWPLITPITNFSEYLPGYFDRMEGRDNTYYVSLPSARVLESPADQEAVGQALFERVQEGSLLVYDEYDGQKKDERIKQYIANVSDADIEIDKFIDEKNGTPAAAVHFTAPIVLRDKAGNKLTSHAENVKQAYDALVAEGQVSETRLIGHDPADPVVDKLWDIYQRQFGRLVENLPQRGLQTEQEFRAMIAHPDAHTLVRFEGEEPVALTTFVTDIAACDWLDKSFYEKTYPGEPLIYFPGIASDPDRRGYMYSADIMKLFAKLATTIGSDFRLVHQCTNISAGYIPSIVERGIRNNSDMVAEVKMQKFGQYNYRGVRRAEQ